MEFRRVRKAFGSLQETREVENNFEGREMLLYSVSGMTRPLVVLFSRTKNTGTSTVAVPGNA